MNSEKQDGKTLCNPNSKPTEFEGFRKDSKLNIFVICPTKWTIAMNAIGMGAPSGRYGDLKDFVISFYRF